MTISKDQCIFCDKTNCKVILTANHFFIIRDTAYPVTKHHTLIITNRHVSDYFDLTSEEVTELNEILNNQKKESGEKLELPQELLDIASQAEKDGVENQLSDLESDEQKEE